MLDVVTLFGGVPVLRGSLLRYIKDIAKSLLITDYFSKSWLMVPFNKNNIIFSHTFLILILASPILSKHHWYLAHISFHLLNKPYLPGM